jgi:Ca-activated chloride channel family protein
MDGGMRKASQMLGKYESADASEYENRVIFMTDAMPNIGRTSDEGLLHMTEQNAQKGIHTSFVGMGVDFNTELVEAITSVKGANYFSVHSSKQFKNRMDRDFKYMVTPLVYNLTLRMDSDAYSIEKVYGSTAAEESTGRLMRVNTLFPSRSKDGETKGGVVLVKLDRKDSGSVNLKVSYENREGKTMQNTQQIDFRNRNSQYFGNTGVRKAVVLSRYGELMKSWIEDGRGSQEAATQSGLDERDRYRGGRLGQQERQSVPLFISDEYRERMRDFRRYLETEKEAIGDQALQQEIDMIDTIFEKAGRT